MSYPKNLKYLHITEHGNQDYVINKLMNEPIFSFYLFKRLISRYVIMLRQPLKHFICTKKQFYTHAFNILFNASFRSLSIKRSIRYPPIFGAVAYNLKNRR